MSAGGSVVIADDDADIRALIALSVIRAGGVVAAAVGTGDAALAAITELTPDLAILDISMPGMTGLEICRAVRANPVISNTRILLLSASVHPAAMAEGGAAGADAYEAKPFSPRKLAIRIRDMLQPRPVRVNPADPAVQPEALEELHGLHG